MTRARLSFACAAGLSAALLLSSRPASADDGPAVAPIVRLALGPSFHIAPKAEKGTEVAFDATAGVNFAVAGWSKPGMILSAEAGYAYDGITDHAFQLAPGIGYGHPLAFVSYHPHLLIGSGLGLRNGLAMHLLGDMMSAEVSEQFMSFDGAAHHDFRVMFGVNPAAFVFGVSRL